MSNSREDGPILIYPALEYDSKVDTDVQDESLASGELNMRSYNLDQFIKLFMKKVDTNIQDEILASGEQDIHSFDLFNKPVNSNSHKIENKISESKTVHSYEDGNNARSAEENVLSSFDQDRVELAQATLIINSPKIEYKKHENKNIV